MAEKRMFARRIIENDAFIDLPATARLLYYDLGMRADDDGFIDSPKAIVRQTGASMGDLNALISCGLVISFKNGIIVITHWKMNNYIQKDRYKPTMYEREKQMLTLGENNAYLLDLSKMDTDCIQNGDVDKNRIDKINNIYRSPDGEQESLNQSKRDALSIEQSNFELIYDTYPRKRGKAKAFQFYRQYLKNGREVNGTRYRLTNDQIWAAVQKFVDEQKANGTALEFYPYFSTFLSTRIIDYLEERGNADAGS